jgi:hypothetical protein
MPKGVNKKAKEVQRKQGNEGCREAQCCYNGKEDAGRPNPAW